MYITFRARCVLLCIITFVVSDSEQLRIIDSFVSNSSGSDDLSAAS